MYIKIVGSLFLLGSAASIGFIKSEELTERVKKLQEMKRMMILLQGELRFHRAALSEAFENVAERVKEPFGSFLKETGKRLECKEGAGFDEIWEETSAKLLMMEGMNVNPGVDYFETGWTAPEYYEQICSEASQVVYFDEKGVLKKDGTAVFHNRPDKIYKNVKDVESYNLNVVLYNDGTVAEVSGNEYYKNLNEWTDMVQLTTYNKGIRGLRSDGTGFSAGRDRSKCCREIEPASGGCAGTSGKCGTQNSGCRHSAGHLSYIGRTR